MVHLSFNHLTVQVISLGLVLLVCEARCLQEPNSFTELQRTEFKLCKLFAIHEFFYKLFVMFYNQIHCHKIKLIRQDWLRQVRTTFVTRTFVNVQKNEMYAMYANPCCLTDFVHHRKLQRSVGPYVSYLTQSVQGKTFSFHSFTTDKFSGIFSVVSLCKFGSGIYIHERYSPGIMPFLWN